MHTDPTRVPYQVGDNFPSLRLSILLERFQFRHEERDRDNIDYKAREVIGAVKLACWEIWQGENGLFAQRDLALVMQSAHQAKEFWNEDKLRRVGLWKGRTAQNKHSQDALKHILYHRTFALEDDTLLFQLKPKEVKA